MIGTERKGVLVNRKFYQYLGPMLLSELAISLNEFVDGIIVSQLLGSDAMSMVGMASPVMYVFAVIYIILGVGGSAAYAEYSGMQKKEKADRLFSVVFASSVGISAFIATVGMICLRPLASLMCADTVILPEFTSYLAVTIISGVLIIPLQVLINCFAAFGYPQIGTKLNLAANAINLVMDYVFIHYFHTGVKGAAMATFSGYLIALMWFILLLPGRKVSVPLRKIRLKDVVLVREAAGKGVAMSLNQLGYAIKTFFGNSLSMTLAGIEGVTIFTLCMQSISIISIAMGGVVEAMVPIGAALKGQKDFKGIKILLRTAMIAQFIACLVCTAGVELFPQIFLYMYNYSGADTAAADLGIRIFSLVFIFRGFVLIFMYYFQIVSRKLYASFVSIYDGFAGLIPIAMILTGAFGIRGLWMAFPAVSLSELIIIILANLYISAHSGGKYHGLLLVETEDESVPVYDVTVQLDTEDISDTVVSLQRFCESNDVDQRTSVMMALSLEEMISYMLDNKEHSISCDEVDILAKIREDNIMMDIRSIGMPLDPTTAPVSEYSNVEVLRKVAQKLEYTYVVGMNQTRIMVRRDCEARS